MGVNQVLMDKTVKMVNMEKTVNQVDLVVLVQPVPAVLSVLQVQLVKKVPKVEKDARVKMVFPAKTVDLVSQVSVVKKVSVVRRGLWVTQSRVNKVNVVFLVNKDLPVNLVWLVFQNLDHLVPLVKMAFAHESVNQLNKLPSSLVSQITVMRVVRPFPSMQS